jgi:hypothetical protein
MKVGNPVTCEGRIRYPKSLAIGVVVGVLSIVYALTPSYAPVTSAPDTIGVDTISLDEIVRGDLHGDDLPPSVPPASAPGRDAGFVQSVKPQPPTAVAAPSWTPSDAAEEPVVARGNSTGLPPPLDVQVARTTDPIAGQSGGLPALGILQCHLDAQTGSNAANILQECIDRAPGSGTVEIPPGKYVLHRRLVVSKPLTIRTAGSSSGLVSCVATPDRCAILMAAPDLVETDGFLLVHKTTDVVVEHVILDGNRAERLSSPAAESCQAGRNRAGFNAAFIGCVKCALQDVVSRNALCGSGMVWSGRDALIQRNEFSANGDAAVPRMWADGLTVVYAPHSLISWNRLVDNSDVALIVGYGVRSSIERNVIVQRTQPAFAGLMLHNFNSNDLATRGDFRGSEVKYNTVDCGFRLCLFGIQLGPWPWDPTKNIIGGEVHDNDVRGAKVGINADGAGIVGYPMAIFANTVTNVPSGAYFADCAQPIPAEWMNIAPTSVVDRRDEAVPAGAHLSDPCQFWSHLAIGIP